MTVSIRLTTAGSYSTTRRVDLHRSKYALKLPTIDLKDLGGKNGATPAQKKLDMKKEEVETRAKEKLKNLLKK
jgi:hypothetical protein